MEINTRNRLSQRELLPKAINPRHIDLTGLIQDTVVETGTFTLVGLQNATLTSTISNSKIPTSIIATCPYMVSFYLTSFADANLITMGSAITKSDYTIVGPIALPQVS